MAKEKTVEEEHLEEMRRDWCESLVGKIPSRQMSELHAKAVELLDVMLSACDEKDLQKAVIALYDILERRN